MALRIKTFQDLEQLSEINGLSILCEFLFSLKNLNFVKNDSLIVLVIDERSRPFPVNDKSLPDWRCRSHTGFLGPNDKFLECLKADWIKYTSL